MYSYDDDAVEEDRRDDHLFATVFKDHEYTLGDSEMESECIVGNHHIVYGIHYAAMVLTLQ